MDHVFVRAKFRGRGVLEVDKMLVDNGASFTVMPLDVAEKYFIERTAKALSEACKVLKTTFGSGLRGSRK